MFCLFYVIKIIYSHGKEKKSKKYGNYKIKKKKSFTFSSPTPPLTLSSQKQSFQYGSICSSSVVTSICLIWMVMFSFHDLLILDVIYWPPIIKAEKFILHYTHFFFAISSYYHCVIFGLLLSFPLFLVIRS